MISFLSIRTSFVQTSLAILDSSLIATPLVVQLTSSLPSIGGVPSVSVTLVLAISISLVVTL